MECKVKGSCDVFVAGAGIAGIMAAIEAAKDGRKVVLSSSTHIFSGSSFYPGTWGLGFVTPKDQDDQEEFIQTILKIGCHMADEDLVRSFVKDMIPILTELEEMGLELMKAKATNQREFIPCFDHKTRNWRGIVGDKARVKFKQLLNQYHVTCLEQRELVEIVENDGAVSGVILCHDHGEIEFLQVHALILATGGYGGLFQRRLTTDEITGVGQWLAIKHGCSLVNMEFMQMMPALVQKETRTSEMPIIFNEKTFKYVSFWDEDQKPLWNKSPQTKRWLDLRSMYGPFTSERDSKEVDYLIAQSSDGVWVTYDTTIQENMPEFVSTYFEWLDKQKGISVEDPIQIAMYAHAANGGIKIKTDTSTNLKGLFACGEVSGGMHGADRIGGLSTANGFVFGKRAGKAAGDYVSFARTQAMDSYELELWEIDQIDEIQRQLHNYMTEYAMIFRSEDGLQLVIDFINKHLNSSRRKPTNRIKKAVDSRRMVGQLYLAKGILLAEQMRKESRGSHHRSDYPESNHSYNKRIEIKMIAGNLQVQFENGDIKKVSR